MDPSLIVAIIGVLGIAFTQWRADVRADKERRTNRELDQARRDEDREAAEREYRRKLKERWIDERRAAHARLLSGLGQAHDRLFLYVLDGDGLPADAASPPAPDLVSPEDFRELWDALAMVQLIASDDAVLAARLAVDSVYSIMAMADGQWGTIGTIVREWKSYEQSRAAYEAHARGELGVAEEPPPLH